MAKQMKLEKYELYLRPGDNDSHFPLKLFFADGKRDRTEFSQAFRERNSRIRERRRRLGPTVAGESQNTNDDSQNGPSGSKDTRNPKGMPDRIRKRKSGDDVALPRFSLDAHEEVLSLVAPLAPTSSLPSILECDAWMQALSEINGVTTTSLNKLLSRNDLSVNAKTTKKGKIEQLLVYKGIALHS